ncbi:uncharacterized protein PADG_11540 [Paracoccidioides brasiliensis Pb18]|uniref:Uncharacterized protein n=1 Tax=Paracoccidioides brasiliensis (strain Pb18) TaxID=502780 RepID=A0A0A0HVG4_PARBD|nr:uncharacterized protein PADG_11540 [Paracoccidioides brasiliensis Pb18]KGM92343.1 hypothetical protein PADG_11540 [Paracoccidioides brasiliensis Pb18]
MAQATRRGDRETSRGKHYLGLKVMAANEHAVADRALPSRRLRRRVTATNVCCVLGCCFTDANHQSCHYTIQSHDRESTSRSQACCGSYAGRCESRNDLKPEGWVRARACGTDPLKTSRQSFKRMQRPSAAESLQPTKQTQLLDWSMLLQMANHHRGPADNNDMGGMRSDGGRGRGVGVGRDLKSTGGFSSGLVKEVICRH